MWEFFEQLLSQLPSRDFVQTSVTGAIDRAIQSFKAVIKGDGRQQIENPLRTARTEQAESDPTQQKIDESRAKLDRMRDMLAGLKTSSEADDRKDPADSSPKHVIVDNIGDANHETETPAAPEAKTGVIQAIFDKLNSAQSPEWHGKSEAEKKAAYEQRFGPEKMVEFVDQFPKEQQAEAKRAWWRKTINRRLSDSFVDGRRKDKSKSTALTAVRVAQTMNRMQRAGRAMQMWGGRFSAMGGRIPGMIGRGLGRAGIALEGLGGAGALAGLGTVGVTIGAFAAGLAAAVGAVVGFVKGTKAAGESLLEQQRRYASMSMGQAQAMGMTTLNQLQNDMKTARGTEAWTLELAKEMGEFRDALQPLDQLVTNLELAVVSKLVDVATLLVNGMKSLGQPIEMLSEQMVRLIVKMQGGNEQMQDAAGLRMAIEANLNPPIGPTPMDQLLRNLRDAAPAPGRPPLPPIR